MTENNTFVDVEVPEGMNEGHAQALANMVHQNKDMLFTLYNGVLDFIINGGQVKFNSKNGILFSNGVGGSAPLLVLIVNAIKFALEREGQDHGVMQMIMTQRDPKSKMDFLPDASDVEGLQREFENMLAFMERAAKAMVDQDYNESNKKDHN